MSNEVLFERHSRELILKKVTKYRRIFTFLLGNRKTQDEFIMRKSLQLIFLLCFMVNVRAQENTAVNDPNYLEDQLYFSLTYNILKNKPPQITQNGFSGGVSFGFIKDLPINKERNFGFGLGLGFIYNVYIQNLKITEDIQGTVFSVAQDFKTNRFTTGSLEIPIEIRWRNSTPEKYKFWRVYGGFKLSYSLFSKSEFVASNQKEIAKNIAEYNKVQYGIILATGYNNWNLYMYYSLKSFFKESQLNSNNIDMGDFNVGLKFYIM